MDRLHYDVRLRTDAGTQRLTSGTGGTWWERVLHNVTWTRFDTLAEATAAAKDMLENRTVYQAWVIEVDGPRETTVASMLPVRR